LQRSCTPSRRVDSQNSSRKTRHRILVNSINSEVCSADLFESDLPQNVPTADTLRSRSGASVTSTEAGRIQTDGARRPSLGNHGKHRCGTLPEATSSATFTNHHCRTCAAALSRPLGHLDEITCCDRDCRFMPPIWVVPALCLIHSC
jgi:hypothetical protein